MLMLVQADRANAKDASPPVKTVKPGSSFVQCDGSIAAPTVGGTTVAVLAIIATAGLAGSGEMPDVNKRRDGQLGIDACNEALATESNETRRVELTLARAVHAMEAKNFEAALADARSIPTVAGSKAQDRGFRHSLALGAMEIEAAALVQLGRPAEAEQVALNMAAAAPYEVVNLQRSIRFIGLTDEMTPAKTAYFDRLVRVLPAAFFERARAREWSGDFRGAATDLETLVTVWTAFQTDNPNAQGETPDMTAQRAVDYFLAGDVETSRRVTAQARVALDEYLKSGKALNNPKAANAAAELLDLQAITEQISRGEMTQARAAFASRSLWLSPSAPVVAAVTAKLRQGASPAELTGSLARDPAKIRSDGLAARLGAAADSVGGTNALYGAIRVYERDGDFGPFVRSVWKTDKSRFLAKRAASARYRGEMYIAQAMVPGVVTGEVLLMHCALMAKARGKSGFILAPGRKELGYVVVQYGDPGEPGFPADAIVSADEVISALSPTMPNPATTKSN